jgi:hypothetical protein
MKRITLFMVALIAFFSSTSIVHADGETTFAVADTALDVSKITEGYFVIGARSKGNNGLIYQDGTSGGGCFKLGFGASKDTASAVTASDTKYIWHVTNTANGLVIQNASTGKYIPAQNGQGGNMNQSFEITNAGIFATTASTGSKLDKNAVLLYQVKYTYNSSTPYYIHCNNSNDTTYVLSYWNSTNAYDGSGSGTLFAFYAVTIPNDFSSAVSTPSYAVQVTGTDGTTTTYTVETSGQDIENGSNFIKSWTANAAEVSYWYTTSPVFSVNESTKTVSRENVTFTAKKQEITYTEGTPPFTYSDSESTTWYKVKFRNADANTLVANSENAASKNTGFSTTYTTTSDLFKGSFWAFEKSGYGVKIKSLLTGKYVTCGSDNSTVAAVNGEDGTEFIALKNSSNSSAGFTLKFPGVTSVIGEHAGGKLGAWNTSLSTSQNDGGSAWTLTAADDILSDCKSIVKSLYYIVDDADGTLLQEEKWSGTAAEKTTLATAIKDANSFSALIADNILGSDVTSKIASESSLSVEDGAYYRLVLYRSDASYKYPNIAATPVNTSGTLENNSDIFISTDATVIPSQLFKLEGKGTSYKIKFANVNKYVVAANETNLNVNTSDDNATTFTIKSYGGVATTLQLIFDSSHYVNAYGGDKADTHILKNYDTASDAGGMWHIEKITSIPVSIKDIGFASVCFPFAVNIPDGVTVFYATEAKDGKLYLTSFDGGVIPANTGAIVKGENGSTYNFYITTTEETNPTGNKLQGATARRSGFTTETTYALGNNSGNAAFMLNTLTLIPANKAYMNATDVTTTSSSTESVSAFDFTYGGVVDAIENATVKAAADKEVYYDLQGHRVLYPTTGIYVTASGQKVLIK